MLWKDPVGAGDANLNGALFPEASFVDRPANKPPSKDDFCSSHVRLEDLGAFIAGGTEPGAGEVGVAQNHILKDQPIVWESNEQPLQMASRRWYPTATLLGSGKVLIHSGSRYLHTLTFGGLTDSSDVSPHLLLTPPFIDRLGLSFDGNWDAKVSPFIPSTNDRPTPREFASANDAPSWGRVIYFGGRDLDAASSTDRYKNDTWSLFGAANHPGQANSDDYDYVWQHENGAPAIAPDGVPIGRYLHATTILGSKSLVLYGGAVPSVAGEGGVSDVWVFSDDGTTNPPAWHKVDIALSGHANPGARCGQILMSDPARGNIYMFGGAASPAAAPTDAAVYQLFLTYTAPVAPAIYGTYSGYWETLSPVSSAVAAVPLSRFGKAMDASNYGTPASPVTRAVIFGGLNGSGAVTSNLRTLTFVTSGTSVQYKWETITTTGTAPAAGLDASFAYEPSIGRALVMGGRTQLTGTGATPSTQIRSAIIPDPDHLSTTSAAWASYAGGTLTRGVAGSTAVVPASDVFSRVAEIYDPYAATNRFTSLTNSPHLAEWYPFMFVIPNQTTDSDHHHLVFEAGPRKDSWMLDLNAATSNGVWKPVDTSANSGYIKGGSAVMYRIGKVMKCGSRDTELNLDPTSKGTYSINLTGVNVPSSGTGTDLTALRWQHESDMNFSRVNHNLVMLPTGDVMVFNGTTKSGNNDEDDADFPFVFTPELWTPPSGSTAASWTAMTPDPFQHRRGYHSSAFLLPDGRVMVGGGNTLANTSSQTNGYNGFTNTDSVQIYSPPYLFGANDALLSRPNVVAMGGAFATYGDVCTLDTDIAIDDAVLIRPAATTHGFNPEQRFLPLTRYSASTASNPYRFTYRLPVDPDSLPPGDYMLFARKSGYAPSYARWVHIRRVQTTTAARDPGDRVRPGKISGFNLDECVWPFAIRWVAPSDDSTFVETGRVNSYDIRYSEAGAITTWSAFAAATPFWGASVTADPGNWESLGTQDLTVGHTYWISGLAYDDRRDVAQSSALSPSSYHHILGCDTGLYGGGGGGGDGFAARRAPGALSAGRTSESGAAGASAENSLLDALPPSESRRDLLPLASAPQLLNGHLRVQIRRGASGATLLHRVRLLAVDGGSADEALSVAGMPIDGTRVPLATATDRNGVDVASQMNGTSEFRAARDETLLVTLPAAGAGTGNLLIRVGGTPPLDQGDDVGVLVQLPQGGDWRTLVRIIPHDEPAETMVDSVASNVVRLVFRSGHEIQWLGRLLQDATPPALLSPSLVAATHSRLGPQPLADLSPGGSGTILSARDTLLLDFAAVPDADTLTRRWYLEVSGVNAGSGATSMAMEHPTSEQRTAPLAFALEAARPNPFSHSTQMSFTLPRAALVRLDVFDLLGRHVRTLASGRLELGRHTAAWNRLREDGGRAGAGVYLVRLLADGQRAEHKVIVIP